MSDSIAPTFTSPIAIPTEYLEPPGDYTAVQNSAAQESILNTISDIGESAILQNPVTAVITGMGTGIGNLLATVSSSSCLSGGDKTTITNSISGSGGLNEQLALLQAHTNLLSGVVTAGSGDQTAGLASILSAGRSLNNIANTARGAQGCAVLFGAMSGLFSADQLNEYSGQLGDILQQVNACVADAATVAFQINQMAQTISNIIAADRDFFNQSLTKLKQAALASTLESIYSDPCGKFLLENAIGRTNLISTLKGA
jgi:hypothetical protein